MCVREVEGAILLGAVRGGAGFEVVDRGAVGARDVVEDRVGGREEAVDDMRGRVVTLVSMDGSLGFFCLVEAEVLMGGILTVLGSGGGAEASDMGGEGGSLTGVLVDETEDVAGGVETIGELAPEIVL